MLHHRYRGSALFCAAMLLLLCRILSGCSGIGTARVTEVDGLPCFGIPSNWDTWRGIPSQGLDVSESGPEHATGKEANVWRVTVEPPGRSIIARPAECVIYGRTPVGTASTSPRPLVPNQVYHVFIDARPNDSGLMGYQAEFCMKPRADGRAAVQLIEWDEKLGRRNYEACAT